MGPMPFPSPVIMRERPTIDKLCLSKLDVPRLLIFREKFIRLANANYPEELLVTHYMDSRVRSIVLTTIKTEEKFEALWDRIKFFGVVLQTEHQLLTNREVYIVLTLLCDRSPSLRWTSGLGSPFGMRPHMPSSRTTAGRTFRRTWITTCRRGPITGNALSY